LGSAQAYDDDDDVDDDDDDERILKYFDEIDGGIGTINRELGTLMPATRSLHHNAMGTAHDGALWVGVRFTFFPHVSSSDDARLGSQTLHLLPGPQASVNQAPRDSRPRPQHGAVREGATAEKLPGFTEPLLSDVAWGALVSSSAKAASAIAFWCY